MENVTAEDASKRRCSLIADPPSKDCYCVKLTSQCIEMTIYYCGNHYRECEMYQAFLAKA
jgi:hypothetical protein